MHRHPVSPTGVLLLVFFDLLKVSKITTKFFDLFKVGKNTKKQPSKEQPSQIDITVVWHGAPLRSPSQGLKMCIGQSLLLCICFDGYLSSFYD